MHDVAMAQQWNHAASQHDAVMTEQCHAVDNACAAYRDLFWIRWVPAPWSTGHRKHTFWKDKSGETEAFFVIVRCAFLSSSPRKQGISISLFQVLYCYFSLNNLLQISPSNMRICQCGYECTQQYTNDMIHDKCDMPWDRESLFSPLKRLGQVNSTARLTYNKETSNALWARPKLLNIFDCVRKYSRMLLSRSMWAQGVSNLRHLVRFGVSEGRVRGSTVQVRVSYCNVNLTLWGPLFPRRGLTCSCLEVYIHEINALRHVRGKHLLPTIVCHKLLQYCNTYLLVSCSTGLSLTEVGR